MNVINNVLSHFILYIIFNTKNQIAPPIILIIILLTKRLLNILKINVPENAAKKAYFIPSRSPNNLAIKKIITVDTTKPITKTRIVHIWGNSLHFEILDHNNFFHNDSSLLYSGFK
jgi:hypothetical protein